MQGALWHCLLEAPVAAEAEREGGARRSPRGATIEADVPLAVVRAICTHAKSWRSSELALVTTRVREAREVSLEFREVPRGPYHRKLPAEPDNRRTCQHAVAALATPTRRALKYYNSVQTVPHSKPFILHRLSQVSQARRCSYFVEVKICIKSPLTNSRTPERTAD